MIEITVKLDQWEIQSELTFVVDKDKFTDDLAKNINQFWGDADYRLEEAGSHFNAAIRLYAQECFRLIAFNNFKDESFVTEQFNWKAEKGEKGVEGFPSFEEAGLTLKNIENWHIEFEHVSIEKA